MNINILKFYRNEIKNNRGVFLKDIWTFNDYVLEKNHYFIQWLFPTDQRSKFNWTAPRLTQEDIDAMKNEQEIMSNFRHSLEFFLRFYGLELQPDDSIVLSEDFNKKSKNWITPNNHNYKRISRILRFLTIFEFLTIKRNLMNILIGIYEDDKQAIGEDTYNIWINI